MDNKELYETIFKRKSIRKYDMTPLPDTDLDDLKNFVSQVKVLDPDIQYMCTYLAHGDVKNLLPIKAPHYICLYSEKKENYLMNAGFLLQQVDLYLSAKGIGTCWLGMAKPSKQVMLPIGDMEFIIMIAFGNTDELLHRTDTAVFIRKSMSAISTIEGADELLEPVRLSPSASNSQPWLFSGTVDEIEVRREMPGVLKAPLYDRMNQIDIGIALCHLWLSLDHLGKTVDFVFQKNTAPEGYECMVKVFTGSKA